MKKIILAVGCWIWMLDVGVAQNPLLKQWDYRFGGTSWETIYSFQETNDGGFLLGGASNSDSSGDKTQPTWGGVDYWVVKINSIGIKQWDKRFGGTGSDRLSSLQQTIDGGFILGGYSHSDSSGDKTQNSQGWADYWIIKIDSFGNKQWDKSFGGSLDDWLFSIKQTNDGGYFLGGYSRSGIGGDKTQPNWDTSQNTYDYWVLKIDSFGNKQWDKVFGGTEDDLLFSTQQIADGGYVLGGSSRSDSSGDKTQNSWGVYDYWIIKIDSIGIKLWDYRFGAANNDEFSALINTGDNGFLLGGYSVSGIGGDKSQNTWGSSDYWIIKIDSLGNKLWDKDYGGMNSDHMNKIIQLNDGGYLLIGDSYSNIGGDKSENNLGIAQVWILKSDSAGIKQWDKTIFTTALDHGGIAVETNDECYAVTNWTDALPGGYKTQLPWNNSLDYWIVKFCDTTLTTSIPSNIQHQNQLSISPNPASELAIISGQLVAGSEIQLIDVFGKTLFKKTFTTPASQYSIPIAQYSNGIYFMKVIADGMLKVKKLMKY